MKYRIIFATNLLIVIPPIMPLLTEEESALDPYRILSLEVGATEQEIKKAYRKASLKWHPDKSSAPEARTSIILPSNDY
jgi:DnaJ-class molecular chaperone